MNSLKEWNQAVGRQYAPLDIIISEKAIDICYHLSEQSCYTTQLVQKCWGDWMLGAMIYSSSEKEQDVIIGASTDFECVFRCGSSPETIDFRGGNHGDYANGKHNPSDDTTENDRMISMTLSDATTHEPISLDPGKKVSVHGLNVSITSYIYDGHYSEENILMKETKEYLFDRTDIFVHTFVEVVKNTYFSIAYTCMFPVNKEYGDWVRFYEANHSTTTVRTPIVGTSQYGSNTSEYHHSSKIEFWGTNHPDIHMLIQIYNPEDQFYMSRLFTRLWDMNYVSNKLYVSAFGNGVQMVSPGTQWNYYSSWSFSHQPEFQIPDHADELLGF